MSNATNNIAHALNTVRNDIHRMAIQHGRNPSDITLLAVSKTKPVAQIESAIAAGQHAFGENYPDEGLEKIDQLRNTPCQWHFIGSIQSRKAAGIAQHFDWVHSVARLKVATKLSRHRPTDLPPLQICLQVNIDNESSKSGVQPDQLEALASECAQLPHLQLRGLMAIPAPSTDFAQQRDAFARVRTLFEVLQTQHTAMDTLSMGMSGDLEAAIAEGATMVRVGTAIFGARAAIPAR